MFHFIHFSSRSVLKRQKVITAAKNFSLTHYKHSVFGDLSPRELVIFSKHLISISTGRSDDFIIFPICQSCLQGFRAKNVKFLAAVKTKILTQGLNYEIID